VTVKLAELGELPPTVSVEEVAEIPGVSRSTAFNMAKRFLDTGNGLPVLKCGRRLVVPVPRLLRLLGMEGKTRDEELKPARSGPTHPDEGDPV
jgi:hypothetical protein